MGAAGVGIVAIALQTNRLASALVVNGSVEFDFLIAHIPPCNKNYLLVLIYMIPIVRFLDKCYNINYMHRRTSKQKKRAQLAFIYTLMSLAVVTGVVALILIVQGYRFNRYDGRVEQGALVQFNSRPDGATVTVDQVKLANRTQSKVTVTAGKRTFTMSRDGYTTWSKTLDVSAGSVLWLNYARLFPLAPKIASVADFGGSAQALMSPNRKQAAVIDGDQKGVISIVPLEDGVPVVHPAVIDAMSYVESDNSSFSLVSWDQDNRYLIVRHDYDGKSEYLSVDSQNGSARNITSILGVSIRSVEYMLGDHNQVYMLTDANEVRRGHLGDATLSGPLLANVDSFYQSSRDEIVYETVADEAGLRSVGYLSRNATKPRVIHSTSDAMTTVKLRLGKYYGDNYAVIVEGAQATLYKLNLPSSDATTEPKLTKIKSFDMPEGFRSIEFSPAEQRFVLVAGASTATTYDLELKTLSSVAFQGEVSRGVDWIDSFHIASVSAGSAYFYDFDGTNGQSVASGVLDMPLVISNNNKYMYYFAPVDGRTVLNQIQLVNS